MFMEWYQILAIYLAVGLMVDIFGDEVLKSDIKYDSFMQMLVVNLLFVVFWLPGLIWVVITVLIGANDD